MTAPRLGLSVTEAAKLIGMSKSSCYDAVKRGDVPSVRINGRIVVPFGQLCQMFGVDPASFAA